MTEHFQIVNFLNSPHLALRKPIAFLWIFDDFPMIGITLVRQQYCQLERNKGKLGKIIVTI